jgi:hypothetical protein
VAAADGGGGGCLLPTDTAAAVRPRQQGSGRGDGSGSRSRRSGGETPPQPTRGHWRNPTWGSCAPASEQLPADAATRGAASGGGRICESANCGGVGAWGCGGVGVWGCEFQNCYEIS